MFIDGRCLGTAFAKHADTNFSGGYDSMKQLLSVLLAATVFVSLSAPVWAFGIVAPSLTLGDNITIFDENGNKSDGSNVGFEDGETEPGMDNSQAWDLEGFFLNQSDSLSMVGGYNFATGEEDFTSHLFDR